MRSLSAFPLLAAPVLLYNLIAWGGGAVSGPQTVRAQMREILFVLPMASDAQWEVTSGDLLISFALVMLFFELLKATSTGRDAIVNHALSLVIFVFCLVEFLLASAFATSVFFIITLMALLDVLAGFIVTIVSARRDIGVGEGFVD
ncbi:MAG: hypothetical protein ACFB2Z_03825 [Maricaulaceae bacterium]